MILDDCCDGDDELQRLRERRISQLKKEATLETSSYGILEPISQEKEAIHIIANTGRLVIHFRMPSFRRCDIMAQHLTVLAKKYPKTRFIEVDAIEMPFLVAKFRVQVLPCLTVIVMGQLVDKMTGFDDFGGVDDFPTELVEHRLTLSGALPMPSAKSSSSKIEYDSDEE